MDKAFADLAKQLHELGGDVMRKAQRKGLKKVGELMQEAIAEAAPERTEAAGGLLKPGELKGSIRARVHIASDEGIIGGDTSRVVIGPVGHEAQLVANWVENGHAPRTPSGTSKRRRRLGPGKFVPAHPFVRPAFDATIAEAEAAYIASVNEDLQKAMK